MTGKLIVTEYVSLDGVIEDPVGMEESGLGDWTGPYKRGPSGDAFKHRELIECEAMIFGRRTFDGFAAVWPNVQDNSGYARRMNVLPKYLATSRTDPPEWSNSFLLSEGLVKGVVNVKEAHQGDILIFGSASIVHALLPHRLIDEFRLMVYPTVLGRGKRLFPAGESMSLQLIEQRPFDSGIMLLRYAATL